MWTALLKDVRPRPIIKVCCEQLSDLFCIRSQGVEPVEDPCPPTEFLPAERFSAADVRRQSRRLIDDPLMRSVVDSSKAFISVLNSRRQIVPANRAMTDAFGYDSETALGA